MTEVQATLVDEITEIINRSPVHEAMSAMISGLLSLIIASWPDPAAQGAVIDQVGRIMHQQLMLANSLRDDNTPLN